ncbi:MAG: type II secretion system F family protein [Sedimentisphaerales bacterium]|nr:type II secretion system F family protein [Sedimentisphaerales bacterium]
MGKSDKLATTYHNLSITLDAGVSILRSFDIVSEGLQGSLKKVFLGVRESISKGDGLSESMKQYHRTFDQVDLMLVEAAETSGKYPECFLLLSKWYEFRIKILRILKSGLIFPLLILHIALFIVPLPNLVTGAISFNMYLLRVFGPLLVIYISVFMLIYLYRIFHRAKAIRRILDAVILMMPLLGKAVWELSISRFAFAFSMLYKAGVPIMQALPLATRLAGNTSVSRLFEGGVESVKEGNAAIDGFSKRMPSEYRNLWQVGEETGELTKTVDKIAEISSDRAELYFSAFAKWFPKFVYFLICIWMIYQVFSGYANLYQIPDF